jgi:hypothetical protein
MEDNSTIDREVGSMGLLMRKDYGFFFVVLVLVHDMLRLIVDSTHYIKANSSAGYEAEICL